MGVAAADAKGSKESTATAADPKPAAAAALLVSFVPEEINRTGAIYQTPTNNALFLRFHRDSLAVHHAAARQLFPTIFPRLFTL